MTKTVMALLPSRGRPQSLHDSIMSLYDQAARRDQVEIVVAADPDDPVTMRMAYGMHVPCWVAPERYGYGRLHEYFNALVRPVVKNWAGSPQWLMLWNDDARMLTPGWDEVLEKTPPEVLVADLWVDGHSPDLCTFPAVRTAAVRALGSFSPVTCHCDTWWQDIGRALGAIRPVPIRVDHQRFDLTGQHQDQTWAEGQSQYRSAEFYGPHVQAALKAAVDLLRAQ